MNKAMRERIILIGIIFPLIFMLAGCGAATKKKTAAFETLYCKGQYKEATEAALEKEELEDDTILWQLQAASAYMAGGNYDKVCETLDHTEALCKEDDLENVGMKALQTTGELVSNRYLIDYDPKLYDKVLINTYKGLAFMALDNCDNARVEFNRAYDRQRKTVEEYKSEIEDAKKDIAKKRKKNSQDQEPAFDQAKAIDDVMAKVRDKSTDSQWEPYRNFVNPFTTYVGGLYWMTYGEDGNDFGKALSSMQRLEALAPSPVIDSDKALAESRIKGAPVPKDQVWIIFENGLGPELTELRFDVPLFVAGKKSPVKVASFAMPRLKQREQAYPFLKIFDKNKCLSRTYPLASMDRVIQTEYDANFNALVSKAVASMLIKAASQYAATKAAGDIGGILMGVFNALSTEADLRMWTSLPKEYQVARVTRPVGGYLELHSPTGTRLGSVMIPKGESAIVMVRIPIKFSKPAVNVIPLKPRG